MHMKNKPLLANISPARFEEGSNDNVNFKTTPAAADPYRNAVQHNPAKFTRIMVRAKPIALASWVYEFGPDYMSAVIDKSLPPSLREWCQEIAERRPRFVSKRTIKERERVERLRQEVLRPAVPGKREAVAPASAAEPDASASAAESDAPAGNHDPDASAPEPDAS
jgi:hypothetical protein